MVARLQLWLPNCYFLICSSFFALYHQERYEACGQSDHIQERLVRD
jgi:hypothetical protein